MTERFRFNPDLEAALAAFQRTVPPASRPTDPTWAYAKSETTVPTDAVDGRPDPTWHTVENAFARLTAGNRIFAAGKGACASTTAFSDLEEQWRHEIANDHIKGDPIAPDSPIAAVVCCSDHRASPELIFWQGLGRLFIVREAGNLADDSALASLEYAVYVLKVPLIVILGHEGCGAIQAALEIFATDKRMFGTKLPQLVERFRPAWDTRPDDATADEAWLSAESIDRTKVEIEQLPFVKKRLVGLTVQAPNLAIVTGRYDLQSGLVRWLYTGALVPPPPPPTTPA